MHCLQLALMFMLGHDIWHGAQSTPFSPALFPRLGEARNSPASSLLDYIVQLSRH